MVNLVKKLGLSVLVASALYGAEPATINFQGYLTNASDTPISATKSITFKIYDVATGGTALWTETKNITITNGVYSNIFGDTTPFDLTTMKFDKQYYLGINVDGDGEMSPRIAITNVAYANIFKPVAQADLNVTTLSATSNSDESPLTLANVKKLIENWTLNGMEATPTLITGISFNGKTYNEVYHQGTKTIWLDRDIGASAPCEYHADANSSCKGDLFQFNREADGHESRT